MYGSVTNIVHEIDIVTVFEIYIVEPLEEFLRQTNVEGPVLYFSDRTDLGSPQ